MNRIALAIHGGAGTLLRKDITPEKEMAYRNALAFALEQGYAVLQKGGSALDAVTAAVVALEDNELFNAGKGSVFTSEGTHEMDASIMDGKTLQAGAVGAVKHVRNPILLAKEIMLHSGHVFLGGEGALEFARRQGLVLESDEYFYNALRHEQWKMAKEEDKIALDHNISVSGEKKFGTVGAVACDQFGNLASATSTGGMTNKKFGRMGDTPVIGAGTYANNNTCAISCTGHGEMFLRAVAAYDVSALMEYQGLSLAAAMNKVVNEKLMAIEGEGGMIGVDAKGNISLLFNSEGMYRASCDKDGHRTIAIYRDND